MATLETTKRYGKKIVHIVKLDLDRLRICCIDNNFCTMATDEEYANILHMPKISGNIMDIDCIYDIARAIALVSDYDKFMNKTGLEYEDFILHIMACLNRA